MSSFFLDECAKFMVEKVQVTMLSIALTLSVMIAGRCDLYANDSCLVTLILLRTFIKGALSYYSAKYSCGCSLSPERVV